LASNGTRTLEFSSLLGEGMIEGNVTECEDEDQPFAPYCAWDDDHCQLEYDDDSVTLRYPVPVWDSDGFVRAGMVDGDCQPAWVPWELVIAYV
jgi:hypothetical protein